MVNCSPNAPNHFPATLGKETNLSVSKFISELRNIGGFPEVLHASVVISRDWREGALDNGIDDFEVILVPDIEVLS